MATNKARGTKRTCQSNECGARFYDLSRNPIICPICGSIYELASSPLTASMIAEEKAAARKARKPEFVAEKLPADGLPDVEADEVLPDLEDAEAAITPGEDETFLEEEEEEGGDVSGILGGPVAEGDEER